MITKKVLKGEKILLRQIELKDCSDHYVNWLNDPEVNQYLETKWFEQNIDTIQAFVKSQRENNHSVLFAILADRKVHIGNIKIGPIHPYYKYADISYFIGEKSYWGKGIASEAIKLICNFGFKELELHKIEAGTYETAISSWKALEHNGFKREGIIRDKVIFHKKYVNVFRYGLLKGEIY